jgi:hypothetical protein
MRNDNYLIWRNTYYLGILLLVIYAMPKVSLITTFLYPIFHAELLPNLPLITAIGLFTGISAYMAYKYRRLG